ncbi:stress response translation initiation inhibitor YciH [Haloquadratum walsbyi]|jgi:Translation initiation factor 1 (eIF-1/SUI1) and related proteins|uniref:Translation initiation factor 1 (EIF-1/SUI1) related protein n=1 Tax=Haloquadratum walsbyi J07HQW2 TaxID=1238425 RepID=U1MUL5_9EURY|nr:stress response translation initiation inhibitor YciH [Haloquadratum walsbyi]ERG94039.1 MAG: translation initiation factor 1 (eIF-1/SUI1) related protein [Haloquadratum walsbyi J07HQW2]
MTSKICETCGLPTELCVCADIATTGLHTTLSLEERSFNKVVTLINGINDTTIDISSLASNLKRSLGCGGTIQDDGTIELQGDHRDRVPDLLDEYSIRVEL